MEGRRETNGRDEGGKGNQENQKRKKIADKYYNNAVKDVARQ